MKIMNTVALLLALQIPAAGIWTTVSVDAENSLEPAATPSPRRRRPRTIQSPKTIQSPSSIQSPRTRRSRRAAPKGTPTPVGTGTANQVSQ